MFCFFKMFKMIESHAPYKVRSITCFLFLLILCVCVSQKDLKQKTQNADRGNFWTLYRTLLDSLTVKFQNSFPSVPSNFNLFRSFKHHLDGNHYNTNMINKSWREILSDKKKIEFLQKALLRVFY